MDRRTLLLAGATVALGAASATCGRVAEGATGEEIELWPATPPGGGRVNLRTRIVDQSPDPKVYADRYAVDIGRPLLTMFRPSDPDGSAVIVAPGGGFEAVLIDMEGIEVARRLNASGVTVFLLRYRLPSEGWETGGDVPLQDAQRAVRMLRARAGEFGIDGDRIGLLGFSAGGYVAASLATRFDEQVYAPIDLTDRHSARPAFAGLMFPVITMGTGADEGSRRALLGPKPDAATIAAYSCERRVTAGTPPMFICLAADDNDVSPRQNGEAMYDALCRAKVPAEMHIFQRGGHAWGIRAARGKPASIWPDLFLHWIHDGGWARDHRTAPL